MIWGPGIELKRAGGEVLLSTGTEGWVGKDRTKIFHGNVLRCSLSTLLTGRAQSPALGLELTLNI